MSLAPMRDFLFEDYDSGEQFFVECFFLNEAWEIVLENFGEDVAVDLIGVYTPEEAEILGYDTY